MSTPLRLLIVDDEASMRALVRSTLVSYTNIQVTGAQNGADAMNQLLSNRFDLVLLDLTMPIIDGLDMLRTLRASAALAATPVLIITGRADEVRIREAITLGIVGCLIKPFSVTDLRERVMDFVATLQRPDGSVRREHGPLGLSSSDTLLLVDQGDDVRALNQTLLTRLCDVAVDQNEFAALARCASASFHVIVLGLLTDLAQPYEIARRFRQIPGLREAVLLALAPPGDLDRIQQAKCFDIVLPRRLTAVDCEATLNAILDEPTRARLLLHNDSPWLHGTFDTFVEDFRRAFDATIVSEPGPMRGPWVHSVIVSTELHGPNVDRMLTIRSPISVVLGLAARHLSVEQDGVSNAHLEQALTEFASGLARHFCQRAEQMGLACAPGRQTVRIVHDDRRQHARPPVPQTVYRFFDDVVEYAAVHLLPPASAYGAPAAGGQRGSTHEGNPEP